MYIVLTLARASMLPLSSTDLAVDDGDGDDTGNDGGNDDEFDDE